MVDFCNALQKSSNAGGRGRPPLRFSKTACLYFAFLVLLIFAELFSGSPKKRFFVICFVCYGRFVKRLYLPKNLFWGEYFGVPEKTQFSWGE